MRRITTILFTFLLCMAVVAFNNKSVKAEETNAACTTGSTGECTISNPVELKAWATNNNDNIIGKLAGDILLDQSIDVKKIKTLDLAGYTIKADDNLSDSMFVVNGTLTVDDSSVSHTGTINGNYVEGSTEHSNFIRGFLVSTNKSLTINGGTIKNMYSNGSVSGSKNLGSAIYNDGANLTINGGSVVDCVSASGGVISNGGRLVITNGCIKNCKSLRYNGAVLNNLSSSSEITLNGVIDFDNTDPFGKRLDISIQEQSNQIIVGENFVLKNPNNKIVIGIDEDIKNRVSIDDIVKTNNYSGILKNSFAPYYGHTYLQEDTTNHTLSLKSVYITQQPSFTNGYIVKTNIDGTPIRATYQWYKAPISDEKLIGDVGEYSGRVLNFTISKDGNCIGTYNDNYTWTNKGEDQISAQPNFAIFKLSNMKGHDNLSFDYSTSQNLTQGFVRLSDDNGYLLSTNIIDPTGSMKFTIPYDGDFFLGAVAFDNWYTDITISNIIVNRKLPEEKIINETTNQLIHGEANSDVFLRVTYTNDDGVTYAEDSNDVRFGKVVDGYDKQNVPKGVTNDVVILLDTSNPITHYLDVENMKVYVNGIEKELDKSNYSIKNTPTNSDSITLTLNASYISKLEPGQYTYFVKVSNDIGKECVVANLTIIPSKPEPTPSPVNDESCEKVIGPTWHWNNNKGICEDYGVVGTSTR